MSLFLLLFLRIFMCAKIASILCARIFFVPILNDPFDQSSTSPSPVYFLVVCKPSHERDFFRLNGIEYEKTNK